MSGLDILDLRDASQTGSIITFAALAGREVVDTALLTTE
jgi:hypothetical protein